MNLTTVNSFISGNWKENVFNIINNIVIYRNTQEKNFFEL